MAFVAGFIQPVQQTLNGVEEGKARMGEGMCEEETASKKTPIEDQSAKIDTLFMTKTAEKPYPLGPHIPKKYI